MKLLRTIRLDPSDTFIFDRAAEPGEWAVSGSFMFLNDDVAKLEGKARSAFRGGFLGVHSFGWSTLVQIVEASAADYTEAVGQLTEQLVSKLGAPTVAEADAAARAELTFASSLCAHPVDTLIAVHRAEENGDIREAFRSLRPKDGPKPLRAFAFLDAEDDEGPGESIDLPALAGKRDKE